jgi:uncharacterized protein
MKVAILSDIHDNIWKLETLLAALEAETLIFCGDFCAPFTLAQIAEAFAGPLHAIFGNNDGDQRFLSRVASRFPHVTHYPEIGQALALGGVYDLVCHGHSHERVIEQVGETLRVNPGEVMGRLGLSTYALYETSTGQAEIVIVEE